MFFTFGPEQLDLPLVAHCEWDEGRTESGGSPNLRFWICSSQEQVQLLITARGLRHTDELVAVSKQLPPTSTEKLFEIEGGAAGSLGSLLCDMMKAGAHLEALIPPELGGFLEPPSIGPREEGILIWADDECLFHLAIARSKSQAANIIRSFTWMNGSRREDLLTKISGWNARPESTIEAYIVDGVIAELFYNASIWGKYKNWQRRSMN